MLPSAVSGADGNAVATMTFMPGSSHCPSERAVHHDSGPIERARREQRGDEVHPNTAALLIHQPAEHHGLVIAESIATLGDERENALERRRGLDAGTAIAARAPSAGECRSASTRVVPGDPTTFR